MIPQNSGKKVYLQFRQESLFTMKKTILAVMFLVGCGAEPADDTYYSSQSQGVTFGFPVSIAEAPYIVSLRDADGEHHCGGSILSSTKILTATHCISPKFGNVILAGFTQQSQTAQAQRRKVAPGGTNRIAEFTTGDITVLTLSEPLNFNANVQPIRIVSPLDTEFPAVGQETFLTGWGDIDLALDPRLQGIRDRIKLRATLIANTQIRIFFLETDIASATATIASGANSFTPQELAQQEAELTKLQTALENQKKTEAEITQELEELEKTKKQLEAAGIVGGATAGSGDISNVALTIPDHLQGVHLKLSDAVVGSPFIGTKPISDATRRDACSGDSGGPLVFQTGQGPIQVGVVSAGESACGTSEFSFGDGTYGNVKTFHGEIIADVNRGNE